MNKLLLVTTNKSKYLVAAVEEMDNDQAVAISLRGKEEKLIKLELIDVGCFEVSNELFKQAKILQIGERR